MSKRAVCASGSLGDFRSRLGERFRYRRRRACGFPADGFPEAPAAAAAGVRVT
jgi:hypothetical protein